MESENLPMHQLAPLSGVPRGLEYLTQLDQIIVKQKKEVIEILTDFETANKYKIFNAMGQQIYSAKEKSDCCTRQLAGSLRGFSMKIEDNFQNEVIHLKRPDCRCASPWGMACLLSSITCCLVPAWCCNLCGDSCLQEMEVYSPPGSLVGSVQQKMTKWTPEFWIKDASGNEILKIRGPCCQLRCCDDVEFKVLTLFGDQQIGKVTKQWSGPFKELLTDADNFYITFPMDLDVKAKATLLGALFLIDFLYFEKNQN